MTRSVSKEDLRAAVDYLVQTSNYIAQIRQLREILNAWDGQHTVFTDKRACLNALINLGLHSRDKLDHLLALVEQRRATSPVTKRAEYQRDYMRRTRQRIQKAIALEEMLAGKRFAKSVRAQHARRIKEGWMQRRNRILQNHGEIDWNERQRLIDAFWRGVDAELEDLMRTTRGILASALPELPHERAGVLPLERRKK